jgi:hypothetical protein
MEYPAMTRKRFSLLSMIVAAVAALVAPAGFGAEFAARIVDGLGRPIAGVVVNVGLFQPDAGGRYRSVAFLERLSDAEGRVHGDYDEEMLRSSKGRFVKLSKEGYSNYTITGRFDPEYALQRVYPETALDQVGQLAEEERPAALRELLAGAGSLEERIFARDHLFRPALRRLIDDPHAGLAAILILASIGDPDDLRLIARHVPPPRRQGWEDRWAYGVVTSLLAPISEAEWSFLAKCALGEYEDGWVEGGAIQSLKLIANVRSRMVLEAVRCKAPGLAEEVADALAYAATNPAPLADPDLAALGKRVAKVIGGDLRQEHDPPRYNERGDRARIALNFIDGRCLFVYTATFQSVGDVWHLRSIRETEHAQLARVPEPEATTAPK